jgi:predicted O-linked N-acetylglucosamine transferase (SPINDLY family)
MSSSTFSAQVAKYQAAINQDNKASNYWWLGISYLLSGDLAEAQATWFIPFAITESELETIELNEDLSNTLLIAAKEQTLAKNYREALLLREQYQEIGDYHLENILELVLLSDCCGQLCSESILNWKIKEALIASNTEDVPLALLITAFSKMLTVMNADNMYEVLYCINYGNQPNDLIDIVISDAAQEKYYLSSELWIVVLEYCLESSPNHLGALHYASVMCSVSEEFDKSISMAKRYLQGCNTDLDKVHGYYLLTRALMEASDFNQVAEVMKDYKILLTQVLENPPLNININSWKAVVNTCTFFPYLQDNPTENRDYLNRSGQAYLNYLNQDDTNKSLASKPKITDKIHPKNSGVIRVGYIATTLRSHSVGWLSRWLWQYHDKEKFQIFTYFVKCNEGDSFTEKWFESKSTASFYLSPHAKNIADQIRQHEIDILIDLDSITEGVTYEVMAHKPAPVQISWLGWDASGCPTIDYYIADPYVLPDHAQQYYNEKIWRLPETYLAVDGFEIGIPSIRRSDFGIDVDDVIYFSAQKGYKLNFDNIVAQTQVIKQVPNSHLLVKARGDNDTSKRLYASVAEQVGIDMSRIHFLGKDPDELTHRANLQIADVVLDTFPYNGATTTLETLWLGIPMVTKVGEQFAARNSYGFMLNAGIIEGIGETVEEYISWGVKLGLDRELRKHIHDKLIAGRQISPLWNGARFTKQMEEAYTKMWEIYLQN